MVKARLAKAPPPKLKAKAVVRKPPPPPPRPAPAASPVYTHGRKTFPTAEAWVLATRDLGFPDAAIFFRSMSEAMYVKWLDTLDDLIDREMGRKLRRCECPCRCHIQSRMLDGDNLCYRCVTGKHPGRTPTEGKKYVKARTLRKFTAGK